MTAHVAVRVVFDSIVVNLVEASEALAWISAILVALFLVFSSSLVVFAARLTSLVKEAISLQRDLSVTAFVEVPFLPPFATTAVESIKEMKRLENCMFAVYWRLIV